MILGDAEDGFFCRRWAWLMVIWTGEAGFWEIMKAGDKAENEKAGDPLSNELLSKST